MKGIFEDFGWKYVKGNHLDDIWSEWRYGFIGCKKVPTRTAVQQNKIVMEGQSQSFSNYKAMRLWKKL